MKKFKNHVIFILAVFMLFVSCNSDVLTTPPSDYEGSTGRPSTKAFFTGAAPSGVMATQAFYTDKVSLIFNVVPGADYYEIYRAVVPRSVTNVNVMSLQWSKLDYDVVPFRETDRVVIWNDMIPEKERANYRYFYKVRAGSNIDYSNNTKDGLFSEIVEGWTLVPPATLEVTQGEFIDKISIKWTGDDHVQGYLLYMLDSATSKWNIINEGLLAAPAKGVKDYAFDYYVDPANYGNTLYFRLGSVSLGNKPSDMGVIRSGYTFVKGAPGKPKGLKVSQSDYTDRIEISWEKPSDDKRKPGFNWKVLRYTDDTPEVEVVSFNAYDITNPERMPKGLEIVQDGGKNYYVYSDTVENGVVPGVVYHYKVMAFAEMDKEGEKVWTPGKADIKDGAVFAPSMNIGISVSFPSDAPDGRFTFNIPTPFGYMDAQGEPKVWQYNLYGRYNNGVDSPEPYELLIGDIDVSENETVVSYDYSVMNMKNEFAVTIKNATEESKNTEELYKIVLSADNVIVEDIVFLSNAYRDNLTANSDGVYPVVLAVNNAEAFKKLYISINGAEAKEISMDKLKSANFAIESPQKPFETYDYTVYGESLFGRRTKVSKPVTAYGTVTPEKFIKLFEAFAMKPWEFVGKGVLGSELDERWKSEDNPNNMPGYLNWRISRKSTGSLTDGFLAPSPKYPLGMEVKGLVSGSVNYKSLAVGVQGKVDFKYDDFSEKPGISSNGSYTMSGVSDKGDGDTVTGIITVSGMYPASINFANLKVRGYGFAGTYKVTFKNELGDVSVTATQN